MVLAARTSASSRGILSSSLAAWTKQERRRALYLHALDTGVGYALGWAERSGWSRRCRRSVQLLAAVLRLVLSALLGRPRSSFGAVALAALYQFFPGMEYVAEGA